MMRDAQLLNFFSLYPFTSVNLMHLNTNQTWSTFISYIYIDYFTDMGTYLYVKLVKNTKLYLTSQYKSAADTSHWSNVFKDSL